MYKDGFIAHSVYGCLMGVHASDDPLDALRNAFWLYADRGLLFKILF